jgi:hypothetical protein
MAFEIHDVGYLYIKVTILCSLFRVHDCPEGGNLVFWLLLYKFSISRDVQVASSSSRNFTRPRIVIAWYLSDSVPVSL